MIATEQLTAYAERLERILDEIESLKDGLKDLKAEIKSSGFNVRALERIVAIRRNDTADKEAEFLNDVLLYAHATGTHIDLVAPEPNQAPEPVLSTEWAIPHTVGNGWRAGATHEKSSSQKREHVIIVPGSLLATAPYADSSSS